MPFYAIISQDIPNSLPLRQQTRPAHLQRLEQLNSQGKLLLAGPFPELNPGETHTNTQETTFTGSLIVAQFDSLEMAIKWAEADPYVAAGVYAQVTVKPFKKVLP
ncbi:MAG: YciI family protein [Magnetococcus sp. DMHC-6]